MKKTLAAFAIFTLAGCASNATIIPQTDNTYTSIAEHYNKSDSLNIALNSAKKTCGEQMKRHVVVDTRTEYNGMVSEKVRDLADTIAIARNTGWLAGDYDDYRTTITFQCV